MVLKNSRVLLGFFFIQSVTFSNINATPLERMSQIKRFLHCEQNVHNQLLPTQIAECQRDYFVESLRSVEACNDEKDRKQVFDLDRPDVTQVENEFVAQQVLHFHGEADDVECEVDEVQ